MEKEMKGTQKVAEGDIKQHYGGSGQGVSGTVEEAAGHTQRMH